MDLRRLLNVTFAYLTREIDPDKLERFVREVLREKFDSEMTPAELRSAQIRRKERELGIDGGDRSLMEAFSMPVTGSRA